MFSRIEIVEVLPRGSLGSGATLVAAAGAIPAVDPCYRLRRLGIVPEVSLPVPMQTTAWLEGLIGHFVPAMPGRAGQLPS